MQTAVASGVGSMKPFMSGRLPYALFFFANDGDNRSAQKAMAYTPVSIYYLTPAEILPIVGQKISW